MLKPIFAVIATMCLSWGIAFAIQQVRSVPQSEDVIIECVACHKSRRMSPTPLYSCPDCGRYQVAVAVTDDSPDWAESPAVEIAVDDLDSPAAE
jgi:predicted RNA-binding Zn-ribbon protein involved in translation (DUF1610 family)